jgi:signal transduction histidine kinase
MYRYREICGTGAGRSPDETPTVVVVDDDAALRVLVRQSLEPAGFLVEEAADGEQGLAVIKKVSPDIVILDVMMPMLDGFALCRELRRDPRYTHLPIMMITGLEDVQSIEQAFEVGATHFLTKPINWSLLSHHVKYVLRNSRLEHALLESEQALRARVADLEEARDELEKQREGLTELTAQLRVTTDEANAANRAKSDFLATMSHELRTPLNAIIGFSEIIRDERLGVIGTPHYRNYADDIHASGQHLLQVINDILDLSKFEIGTQNLQEEDIEIDAMLDTVLILIKERANAANIDVELEAPNDLPLLRADPRKIKQILINTLDNAIKFTEAGGSATLRVWYRAESGCVFQIADTGIGIAPEDIPKALSRFGQVDSDLNRRFEGVGLGLPLAKAFAEMHGGSLDLQSKVDVGTTVTIRFPADRIVAPTSSAQESNVSSA